MKIGNKLLWRSSYKRFNPGAITRDMDYVRMVMKSKLILCVSLLMLIQAMASANTFTVPTRGYPTIQAGIDYARTHGYDTVEVAQGVYSGTGNINLDFHGAAITGQEPKI